jgi:hypothetical protein
VVVNFTNTAGCPPCRVIKPVYESLAAEYHTKFGPKGTRFLEVEMGVGEGHDIASKHGVSATPTFIFYKDGAKVGEVCGADKRGIEGATQRLLADCFQHAHERMYLPATSRLSVQPITATATPAFAALMGKLEGFAGASSPDVAVLKADVIPLLEGKSAANAAVIDKWTTTTTSLLEKLNPAAVFPVIDLWRLGLLNNTVVAQLVARLSSGGAQPLSAVLSLTARALKADIAGAPRPLLLTALRLTTNLLSPLPLANVILGAQSELQTDLFAVLVDALLHPEISVRKAAADVAVNAAAWRHRVAKACEAAGGASDEDGLEAEWEVELLTALLEGIGREADPDVGEYD